VSSAARFPPDLGDDLEAVLGAIRRAPDSTSAGISEASGLPLGRVRATLAALEAAGIAVRRNDWQGQGKGYLQRWSFRGPGRIELWAPEHDGRRRRLYQDRAEAIEASARSQGPGARASAIVFVVAADGSVIGGQG